MSKASFFCKQIYTWCSLPVWLALIFFKMVHELVKKKEAKKNTNLS